MKFFRNRISEADRQKLRKDRIFLILGGLISGLSFPPLPLNFFIFFGFVFLFIVLRKRQTLLEINRAVYLFGFVFSFITVYWVGAFTEAKDPFLMIAGFFLLLVNPALFFIPTSIFFLTKKFISEKLAYILFPFFWVTFEYIYGLTDLHFPWTLIGNSVSEYLWFIQIADIVGVEGISLIILYINLSIFLLYSGFQANKRVKVTAIVALLLLFSIPISYGVYCLNGLDIKEKNLKVGLIQPNLDPYEKWSGGSVSEIASKYFRMSEKAVKQGAEILIYPETALPVYLLTGAYDNIVDSFHVFTDLHQVPILTGMPDFRMFSSESSAPEFPKYSEEGGYYYTTHNAVYLFTPGSREIQRYGKVKLVPFGEKTPFADQIPFLGKLLKWGVGISGWNKGYDTTLLSFKRTASQNSDSVSVYGLICFESIFPDFVAGFASKGANFIAVVTNDSWYGNTSGPYQHKEIAVLRAIENRKSVVRAANGGISCIIDPYGRTSKSSKMYTEDIIVGDITINNYSTFYQRNPLIVPIFSSVISLWIIGMILLRKINEKWLVP